MRIGLKSQRRTTFAFKDLFHFTTKKFFAYHDVCFLCSNKNTNRIKQLPYISESGSYNL